MAGRSLLFGGASNGSSNMVTSTYPTSSQQPLGSLLMPAPSSFLGSRSMVSFKDVNGANRSEKSFFRSFDQDEIGDEELEEYLHQPEKKRRLTTEQVHFLERSFEAENKLEPERKLQLAKDLGLQPRQIAIWFQNRRARWKTKNLEKEYDTLKASYDSLKADYDNLLNEKEKLKAEVLRLSDKLHLRDKEKDSSFCESNNFLEASPNEPVADSVPSDDISKASAMALKQEDISSAKSDVLDSDSPHYTDGVHSSFLEPGDSSYFFEPDHSDLSQDEDDNLSKNLFPPAYVFPKIEDADFPGPPASASYIGFQLEDHAFNFWLC